MKTWNNHSLIKYLSLNGNDNGRNNQQDLKIKLIKKSKMELNSGLQTGVIIVHRSRFWRKMVYSFHPDTLPSNLTWEIQ